MRKIIITSVLVVGLATGIAYAHNSNYRASGHGGGMMMSDAYGIMGGGYGMMGKGEYGDCSRVNGLGQGGWNAGSRQKFLDDTVELRKEMNEKRFEFIEAQRNPNITREELVTLEKDMIDIRTKLQEKAEQSYK